VPFTVIVRINADAEKRPPLQDDPKMYFGWSAYRYTNYDEEPQKTDKETSILAGGDMKCEVCEMILADVLQKIKSYDHDTILEALEADVIDEDAVEAAPTRMEKYVEMHKKGCNKLFKESVLAKGYNADPCHKIAKGQTQFTPLEEQAPWACLRRRGQEPPSNDDMNMYSVQRESVYHACEATIGRHRDEITSFLAPETLRTNKTRPQKDQVAAACRKAAKCEKRKPSETPEARAGKTAKTLDEADRKLDAVLAKMKKEFEAKRKSASRKKGTTDEL
jgi:hypothetical protein